VEPGEKMRASTRRNWAITFVASALFPIGAWAATPYSYYYTAGQSAYNVTVNKTITVPLYLQEVSTQQGNSLLKNDDGLSEAGIGVAYASGSPSAIIVGASANTGSVPMGFDDPTSAGVVNSTTLATITESTDPLPFGSDMVGVGSGTQSNGVSQVYLGTVTIQGGSAAGITTTFSAQEAGNMGSTFTNDSTYDLDDNADPNNPAGATSLYNSAAATLFTITTLPVPEPASLSLLAAMGLLLTRRLSSKARPH
jgi:hypothetical protein